METEIIEKIKPFLKERDLQFLILRFGLDGNKKHTYAEIARAYQRSPARIRQIIIQALLYVWNGSKRSHSDVTDIFSALNMDLNRRPDFPIDWESSV